MWSGMGQQTAQAKEVYSPLLHLDVYRCYYGNRTTTSPLELKIFCVFFLLRTGGLQGKISTNQVDH